MATITEDYVSFETAKLLKEKGFKEITQGYINADQEIYMCPFQQGVYELSDKKYPYPTLQMTMKWLREAHKLHVNVCPCVEGYYWVEKWNSYVENLKKRYPFGRFIGTFDSYEQACEAAILYCLKNLI